MKKLILILAVSILFINCSENKSEKPPHKIDFTEIKTILDSVYIEDQKYRKEIKSIEEEFGWNSTEMTNHWEIIDKADASNLTIVEEILNKYGWLSREQIGQNANSTLFLVIQHSNQSTQEQYLPMMKKAVKEGNAKANSLALLEDRINLGKGELQIYGSQIGTDQETGELYVLPLFEPEKVNERRMSVGLGTIEEYISHWKIDWDVNEYKKNLSRRVEILKNRKK